MKKLECKWTDTEEQIDTMIENVSFGLQEEIDNAILFKSYKAHGWKQVNLSRERIKPSFVKEVAEWCSVNMKGHYKFNDITWIFEKEEDATLFILRWS